MDPVTDDKRPVDQAVEIVLYAPLGFALEARRLLPTFVERGKQQVQMARMIGQFAVKQGQTEAGKRLGKAQEQAEAILTEFGLRPGESPPGADAQADAAHLDGASAPAPAATTTAAAPARSGAGATALAISDYDSLAASQVIPRLPGLEAAELEAVRSYETAHRGRKTILGKISQLQEA
jgi:hypothetical protein